TPDALAATTPASVTLVPRGAGRRDDRDPRWSRDRARLGVRRAGVRHFAGRVPRGGAAAAALADGGDRAGGGGLPPRHVRRLLPPAPERSGRPVRPVPAVSRLRRAR